MSLATHPSRPPLTRLWAPMVAVLLFTGCRGCDDPHGSGRELPAVVGLGATCGTTDDCADGLSCDRGRCSVGCASDDACPDGTACTQAGYCFPTTGTTEVAPCDDAADCGALLCEDGVCVAPRPMRQSLTMAVLAGIAPAAGSNGDDGRGASPR